MEEARSVAHALEAGSIAARLETLETLGRLAHEAGQRSAACRAIGALAGRAFSASWEVAERAAFVLLEVARDADSPAERVAVLQSMGLGFRNAWLMPFVHSRLFDEDPSVVAAAITAAGGLAFPALEATIADGFLEGEHVDAAISALGRMGAVSAAGKLVRFCEEKEGALAALTEIRSPIARETALRLLADPPSRPVLVAVVRYLAELGDGAIEPTLRRLARDEDAELRLVAAEAMRTLEAEKRRDAGERILVALTERDRALRSRLARRLRTLPVADVLEQAELLLADDPSGVIQIVSEVRTPEVTHFLLAIAKDDRYDVAVRARAAGSIEADEEWEREALVALALGEVDAKIRVAAAQTLGAFAPVSLVVERLAKLAEDRSPAVRGALLWAIQLAARPGDRQAIAEVKRGLSDEDASVRRRAAYVAGNLDAADLVPDLVALARSEEAELRIAAFVALGDIGSPARFADLVHLWNREEDAVALGAVSRALERAMRGGGGTVRSQPPPAEAPRPSSPPTSAPPSLARAADRLPKLVLSSDARVRAAAARVAGLAGAGAQIAALVDDPAPRVREAAIVALGRAGGADAFDRVAGALDDVDPVIQERAAVALLALDGDRALEGVLDLVVRSPDRAMALRLATAIDGRVSDARRLDRALSALSHDDAAYEALLDTKLAVLDAQRPPMSRRSGSVDASILAVFPTWARLSDVRGFAPLARSLRTAESLFAASMHDEADLSAAIVLWMKCLEGYMHAWLSPRVRALRDSVLWEISERLAWPTYQRWLGERWTDPVVVGKLSVELPLRSIVNALRDLQEKRLRLDSPMSVTEWSRILLFLGVDHASGPKNVLGIGSREPERTVRLAHKLQTLAQVRNAATHRSTTDGETLGEFRRMYYGAFEELTQLA